MYRDLFSRKKIVELAVLFALIFFFYSSNSWAACTGASPNWLSTADRTSVNTCVTNATAGDTITISGTASWSSVINITKSLIIQGTGVDSTVITGNASCLFSATLTSGANFRITNMGFAGTGGSCGGLETQLIRLSGNGATIWNSLRIDHVKFTNTNEHAITIDPWWNISSHPKALFDHITFSSNVMGSRFIKIAGNNNTWRYDDLYGTDWGIFIEDSTFTWTGTATGDISDTEHGTRLIVRHNTITNGDIQVHDTGSTQGARGERITEIYNNTFSCTAANCSNVPAIALRGGGYLIYNNTITGNYFSTAWPQIWRTDVGAGFLGGVCNGSVVRACNTSTYYHCSGGDHAVCSYPGDTACTGKGSCVVACTADANCPTGTDGTATCLATVDKVDGGSNSHGWPCRDQTGRGIEYGTGGAFQSPSPVYWYNNTAAAFSNNYPNYFQVNRDYCLHDSSTACGAKPEWTYTPYTYPHPLQNSGVPVDVIPPVRSNGTPVGTLSVGTTTTNLTLTTDENATCKYSPGVGGSYSAMPYTFSTTGLTSHSTQVTGLTNGTTYNYYIRCKDTALNANTNDYVVTFSIGSAFAINTWVQAESCNIASPMTTGIDVGTTYVYTPITDQGYVACTFNIPSDGTYYLNTTVKAVDGGSNSFFVSEAGTTTSTPEIWHVFYETVGNPNYAEDFVSREGLWQYGVPDSDPRIFNFTTGLATITFTGREPDTRLDKVMLVSSYNCIPSKVVFTTQPGGGISATTWSQQPQVTIKDSTDHTCTNATNAITLTFPTMIITPTLICTANPLAAVSGIASFTNCNIDLAPNAYTLIASSPGLTSDTSAVFNISTGIPAKVSFINTFGNNVKNLLWNSQPIVVIRDAGDNQITTATDTVTLTISTNPGSGALICAVNPIVAVSGLVIFSDCSINNTGAGYVLTASAPGLTSALSNAFNIENLGSRSKVVRSLQTRGTVSRNQVAR